VVDAEFGGGFNPPIKIIRMMAVRNEVDVLERNLEWYAAAGTPTVVVDNGSTDGSYELVRAARRAGTVVALERIETERYQWGTLLAALFELACEQRPDAVLLASPDEFFEVADGSELRGAMEEDFAAGYNLLKFANMEFQMTHRDIPTDPDPLTRMQYYTYRPVSMPRGFLLPPGTDMVTGLGHRVVFPAGVEARCSPRPYISRHYPLRTEQQAREKIGRMIDRDPSEPPAARYLRIWLDPKRIYTKRKDLFRYRGDHDWVFTDKAMPSRLKETERALVELYAAFSEQRSMQLARTRRSPAN
jgi:hypothetical protein